MMKLRKSLYFVLCLIVGVYTLSGCIEEYEADISAEDSDLLVVEGTICASKENTFTLSRTQAIRSDLPSDLSTGSTRYYSDTPQMVTDAKVSVHGSDGSEYKAQATSNGHYTCKIGFLYPDVEYYLHIETDGEIYESEPQKPLRTEKISDVRGVQNTPESDIDVLITPDDPFEPDQENYYSWTYDVTWQVYPDYTTRIYYDTILKKAVNKRDQFPKCGWIDAKGSDIIIGASTNYDGQHIRRLKLYDISRGNERIFYRYSGLVHQRAISKGEYEYELARRQASSEMGGLFTPLPSALPSNIHCLTSNKHVIGYVGCSFNTSEYRFFLNANDFAIYRPSLGDKRIWLENPTEEECLQMVWRGLFLCEWEDPFKSADGKLRTAWAFRYQLDVRYKYEGVYIEEPDFWSLNENVSY